jgi:hypothetical protein
MKKRVILSILLPGFSVGKDNVSTPAVADGNPLPPLPPNPPNPPAILNAYAA